MAGNRVPNICLAEEFFIIDEETMCRAKTPPPGPIVELTCNARDEREFQTELHVLNSAIVNFASRFIKNSSARLEYLT